jgi:hypothetical protein
MKNELSGLLKFLVSTGAPVGNLDNDSLVQLYTCLNPKVSKSLIPTAEDVFIHFDYYIVCIFDYYIYY